MTHNENDRAEETAIAKLFAHDFKNPISALSANMSYLEAMWDGADEDVKEAVSDSAVAVRALLHMVDNYLTIARIEAKEIVEPSVVPLDVFVRDTLDRCQGLFTVEKAGLRMRNTVPATMCSWPIVYARLAFENLVLTSLYNTPTSGEVFLEVDQKGDTIVFSVEDTGVAIAPENYHCSFDKYFQNTAKTRDNARYGRALALYAAKLGADAVGGSILVVDGQSPLKRFALTLPVESH